MKDGEERIDPAGDISGDTYTTYTYTYTYTYIYKYIHIHIKQMMRRGLIPLVTYRGRRLGRHTRGSEEDANAREREGEGEGHWDIRSMQNGD